MEHVNIIVFHISINFGLDMMDANVGSRAAKQLIHSYVNYSCMKLQLYSQLETY